MAHRPPVPLSVVRMLWLRLLLRRGGLPPAEPSSQASKRSTASRGQLRRAADEIQHALVSTLAFVDVITDFDRPQEPEDDEDEPCLRINHSLHLLYGRHLARTCPDLFFDGPNGYERFLFKNGIGVGVGGGPVCPRGSTPTSWDPEVELNADMADACWDAVQEGPPPPSPPSPSLVAGFSGGAGRAAAAVTQGYRYEYAVEMMPWHLVRCRRYRDAAAVLTDAEFVIRRLVALGMLEGTRMHVADVEEAAGRILLADSVESKRRRGQGLGRRQDAFCGRADVNVRALFSSGYEVLGEAMRLIDKGVAEAADEAERSKEAIETARDKFISRPASDLNKSLSREQQEDPEPNAKPVAEDGDCPADVQDAPQGDPDDPIATDQAEKDGDNGNVDGAAVKATVQPHMEPLWEDDSSIQSLTQIAQSLQIIGTSLAAHGMLNEAMPVYSRALVQFELVHAALDERAHIKKGLADSSAMWDTSAAHQFIAASSGSSLPYSASVPSLEQIQFLLGSALSGMASIHIARSSPSESMLCYERALSYYSRSNRSRRHAAGVARTLTAMGVLHFRLREWDSAWSCFEEGLGLLRDLYGDDAEETDEVGDVLQWMGNVRREMGRQQEAMGLFSDSLYVKVLLRGKSHPDVGRIHHSMGVVHDDLGKVSLFRTNFDIIRY